MNGRIDRLVGPLRGRAGRSRARGAVTGFAGLLHQVDPGSVIEMEPHEQRVRLGEGHLLDVLADYCLDLEANRRPSQRVEPCECTPAGTTVRE